MPSPLRGSGNPVVRFFRSTRSVNLARAKGLLLFHEEKNRPHVCDSQARSVIIKIICQFVSVLQIEILVFLLNIFIYVFGCLFDAWRCSFFTS